MAKIEGDLDPIAFTEGLYGEVPEIMRELWSRMPMGQEITLSNGRKGIVKKFIEPRERDGRWEFGFDVAFAEGSPDHLEFMVKHTGGGGFVGISPTAVGVVGSA